LPSFQVLRRFEPYGDVIDRDLPPTPSVLLDLLWDTYQAAPSDVTLELWRRLFQLRQPGGNVPQGHFQYTQNILFSLVEKLIEKGPREEVAEVWDQVQAYLGIKSIDRAGSVVWDGGFEGDISGGGLTWRLNSAPDARIQLDRTQKHSG